MRIFVDCSHVDFTKQPTGIPRVVLKYIEQGYRWAEESRVEVVPVRTTQFGIVPAHPWPGRNGPQYLTNYPDPVAAVKSRSVVDGQIEEVAFHLQAALKGAGYPVDHQACAHEARAAVARLASRSSAREAAKIAIRPGDVLFCPAYWHDVPPAHYQAVQADGAQIVILVHDILPVSHGRFYPAPWKFEFEANLSAALRYADRVYAVSRYTADCLTEFAVRKGLADVSVGVSRNGHDPLVGPDFAAKIASRDFNPHVARHRAYDIICETAPFLMVGTLEPKKGHIPVVRSFEAMWRAGLQRPLVIVGRKGWLERSVIETVEQSPFYLDRLFWFDDLDDLDLYFAYSRSRGLIFGSYAEGFGIPLVEALSVGCPVVALDTQISREVAGAHGHFYTDFVTFAEHVRALDSDAGFANAQHEIAGFSWPRWDEIVVDLFDDLATGKSFLRHSTIGSPIAVS